jgi:putative transposase
MIDREHRLPVTRQTQLLHIARSTAYYEPKPISQADLEIMRMIDLLHTEYPFMGARMLRDSLRKQGIRVGRRHVARLMRLMGIEALYRKKKTTKRNPEHPVYPYLLRNLTIENPNHVWAADISYIPMARGFLYLFAIIDWASRYVLAWRLSNSLSADFCIEALEEAIAKYGCPRIFNTDQGAQFTDVGWTDVLKNHGIEISMDGKGCWRDNVFIERLWRTIKYEEVYLRAYDGTTQARTSLGKYITFYNEQRPHSALDGHTPHAVYFNHQPALQASLVE